MTPASAQDPRFRRLSELDSEVGRLKEEFEEALDSLDDAFQEVVGRPDIDSSIEGRLSQVADRLRNLKPDIEALDLDLEQAAALFSAIVDVDRAFHADRDDPLNRYEQMLLGIERIRQVIRDALDEFAGGTDADRRKLVHTLSDCLPGTTQAELAELLSVDPRTLRRWGSSAGEPDQRLVVVARLVKVLRHAWTPQGVMTWFRRARRDLGGQAPIELLSDPGAERALMSAARSSRNQYAS